jgi:mRNA-degrading endonuclease RelE of RelBE toxin-antitoxin system
MSYNVLTIPPFDKQLKRLAKKYPSLKNEFAALLESLEQEPQLGIHLGNNCYKIRMAIASKGKGKSGGARVISNFVIAEKTVFLISIYDKAEKENLSDKELMELLQYIPE